MALGAQLVFVGRPFLYAAAIGDEAGVLHAIYILSTEINRNMGLLGINTLAEMRPDGKARELDWLRNMGDWMISKKRFWGLALPIWVDDVTGEFEVIGSRAELKARAV